MNAEPVFRRCNVCGCELRNDDEFALGACAICANAEFPESATEMESLKKQLTAAQERVKELEEKQPPLPANYSRLLDLVRYQRSELHKAELITYDEYAALCAVPASPRRLESYDQLRAEVEKLTSLLTASKDAIDLILPLAKGYASQHRVMSSYNYIELAEKASATLRAVLEKEGV